MNNNIQSSLTPEQQHLIDAFNYDQIMEYFEQGNQLNQEQIEIFRKLAQRLNLPCPV